MVDTDPILLYTWSQGRIQFQFPKRDMVDTD